MTGMVREELWWLPKVLGESGETCQKYGNTHEWYFIFTPGVLFFGLISPEHQIMFWWISNMMHKGAIMLKGQWWSIYSCLRHVMDICFSWLCFRLSLPLKQSSTNRHLFVFCPACRRLTNLICPENNGVGISISLKRIWSGPSSAFTTPLSSEINYLLEWSTHDCFSVVGTSSNKVLLVRKPWEDGWHKPERKEGDRMCFHLMLLSNSPFVIMNHSKNTQRYFVLVK